MGTRSLTTFNNNNSDDMKEIAVLYRQLDGYPTGHGRELHEFLSNIHIVNGIAMNEDRKIANGMDCLAAQLIAHFKEDFPGGFYLMRADTRDVGEQYVYTIKERTNDSAICVEVYDVYENKVVFDGDMDDMDTWLKAEEEEG